MGGAEKFTGPNTATHRLQIPVMNGRDTTETHFYTEGGNEYMEMAGLLYVSGTNVKPLDAGQSSKELRCKQMGMLNGLRSRKRQQRKR